MALHEDLSLLRLYEALSESSPEITQLTVAELPVFRTYSLGRVICLDKLWRLAEVKAICSQFC